jgi:hypothetical protein
MQQAPAAAPVQRPCRCIVKLGGSAITVKSQHQTLKAGVLASVTAALQQLYQQTQQLDDKPGEGGVRWRPGGGARGM